MSAETTRSYIVEAADRLFYQKGYENTSFSDIASTVKISRGNFYYHFRTKDEILDAVIEHRMNKTRKMLEQWEAGAGQPNERIRSFIHIVITNQALIMNYGCPVGTLSTELAKLGHPSQTGANKIFGLFRAWLRKQFRLMGQDADADRHAMHVLAWSQGVATLANAFHDKKFVSHEVKQLENWLDKINENSKTA